MTELMQPLILTFAFMGMFYFMAIRPETKRKKELDNLRNSLKEGDEITTIGGISGKICAIKDATIVLETGADRVRIELARWAVANKGLPNTPDSATKTS